MTYTRVFHLVCQETGDQLHLHISSRNLVSLSQIESLATGSSTLQVEMCSHCLTTLKRPEVTLLVWPLQMVPIAKGRPPLSFRLCDRKAVANLITIGRSRKRPPL